MMLRARLRFVELRLRSISLCIKEPVIVVLKLTLYPLKFKLCVFRFGRKRTVIVPMVLAALASMGAVLLTRNTTETGG